MFSWKSPGPDGYPASFCQNTWNYIRANLCQLIHQLWSKDISMSTVNLTDNYLIPKNDNPKQVSYYRPISLYNNIYKVFTKVIVNRLKYHMDSIISPNEYGFIPNQSSRDNVVLAQEMFHGINRSKQKIRSFAIKIDLAKAFDNMRWKKDVMRLASYDDVGAHSSYLYQENSKVSKRLHLE
ncbi:unnamed protein product [Lathyrus sativus]|nr:unnamed protein product [Lathyrus sativus]